MRVSTGSNLRLEARLWIALAALVTVLFYLLVSARTFRIGFPLDDAWIHLTYARNFAEHGQWAFRLGESSAGSTAPLWTFLLSIGYPLNLAPYIWSFLLGWLLLSLLGVQAETTTRRLVNKYSPRIPWVGFFFVTAWHLAWTAVSGMETLLHAYIMFYVLSCLLTDPRRYFAYGFLAGLSVWVRPDGMTLLGPILFTAVMIEKDFRARSNAVIKTLASFCAVFVPYLLFNLVLSGNPWPNTFYAKQAEYQAAWQSMDLLERFFNYLSPILASPFIVLLPGAILWMSRRIRARDWAAIATLIWFLGYVGIYFVRMPAYQHGRYIIPAFPVLYLWGILGMVEYITSTKANRMVSLTWEILLGTLCVLFSVVAARQNALDVYWIETEMVETAKWVHENIAPDALLAVHDIGAIGYFDEHRVLDLAGLVSPDVVPFIRDEDRIAAFLDERGADYLITLPSFYPDLVTQKEQVYPLSGTCASTDEQATMCVFRWK